MPLSKPEKKGGEGMSKRDREGGRAREK